VSETRKPKRRPGRPSSAIQGTVAARHLATGRAIGWSDGQWAGHPYLVAAARALAQDVDAEGVEPLLLPWGGGYAYPDDQDLFGALAIIVDYRVCDADAALSGDIPVDYLKALVALGLEDPDMSAADIEAFMAARGV